MTIPFSIVQARYKLAVGVTRASHERMEIDTLDLLPNSSSPLNKKSQETQNSEDTP